MCGTKVELKLNDRVFECPNCKKKEDRDVHAAKNMIHFYLKYIASGTGVKMPVRKIEYKEFVSKLAKQESNITLVYC